MSDNCQVHDWTEIYSDTFFFNPLTSHIRHNSHQRTNKQIHIHILARGIANINKKKHGYKIPFPVSSSVGSVSTKNGWLSHTLFIRKLATSSSGIPFILPRGGFLTSKEILPLFLPWRRNGRNGICWGGIIFCFGLFILAIPGYNSIHKHSVKHRTLLWVFIHLLAVCPCDLPRGRRAVTLTLFLFPFLCCILCD